MGGLPAGSSGGGGWDGAAAAGGAAATEPMAAADPAALLAPVAALASRTSEWALALSATQLGLLAASATAAVATMAAATARHGKFMASELYGPLVAMEQAEGWARLDSKPMSGGEAVTWLCLDVEMCERRRDGERFPVSACVTRTRWGSPGCIVNTAASRADADAARGRSSEVAPSRPRRKLPLATLSLHRSVITALDVL